MSSDVLRVIDPLGYFDSFFSEGVYPDGRGVLDFQKLVFKQGECGGVGSAVVSSDGVTVSCSIEASVSLASDASLVKVEISSSQQLSERDSEEYSSLLLDMFNHGHFVSRDALKCQDSEGNKLPLDWVLNVVVKVLSMDGNLLDAVMCAITAALKNTQLPSIILNHSIEDESAIDKAQILVGDKKIPLEISETLMCSSFGVFVRDPEERNHKEILLLSPSLEISNACKSTCSIIVGEENKIIMVRQRGQITNFNFLKKMSEITSIRRKRFIEALGKA